MAKLRLTKSFFLNSNWILIIILLGFSLLAAYRASECQITIDEFFSIKVAEQPLAMIWDLNSKHPGRFYFNSFPPAYETLLHFVWKYSTIKGYPDLLPVRLVSVFFGVSVIFFIYLLSKLLFNRQTGLTAAVFAGMTGGYIYYAKMIRGYSLLTALTIVSFYIFFRIIKNNLQRRIGWPLLFVINAFVLYTSYLGLFVIAVEIIISCMLLDEKRLRTSLLIFSPALLLLFWVNHFFNDMLREYINFFVHNKMQVTILGSLPVLFLRMQQNVFYSYFLTFAYSFLIIISLVYAAMAYFKRKKEVRWLISLLFILLPVVLFINYFSTSENEGVRVRYIMPFIFPVFIISGFLITKMNKLSGFIIALVLVIFSAVATYNYSKLPIRRFWSEAILSYLAQEAANIPIRPDEKVVIQIEDQYFAPIFIYYFFGPECYLGYERKVFTRQDLTKKKIFNTKPNCELFFNIAGIKEFHEFHSVSSLNEAKWLFLVYSYNWHGHLWSKPFEQLYMDEVKKSGLYGRLTLFKKIRHCNMNLEVFKVNN